MRRPYRVQTWANELAPHQGAAAAVDAAGAPLYDPAMAGHATGPDEEGDVIGRGALALALAVGLLLAPAMGASAQTGGDAAPVVRPYIAAVSAGDVEGALAQVSDNVVARVGPNPDGTYTDITGRAMLRAYLQGLIAGHPKYVLSAIQSDGATVTFRATETEDALAKSGIDALTLTGVALVQDGKIVSAAQALTPESVARLAAARATPAAPLVPAGLPNTGGGFRGRAASPAPV